MNGNIVGYCEGSVIIFDYCIVCRYVCFQSKCDASHSHDPSIHGWFRWFHRSGSKLFSTEWNHPILGLIILMLSRPPTTSYHIHFLLPFFFSPKPPKPTPLFPICVQIITQYTSFWGRQFENLIVSTQAPLLLAASLSFERQGGGSDTRITTLCPDIEHTDPLPPLQPTWRPCNVGEGTILSSTL